MSLTDSLRYTLKGSAVSSRSYVHKIAPTNGSNFQQGGVTRLDCPSGMRNTYLDPSQTWLEFQMFADITSGGSSVATLDGSAHSFIRKVEVYSSAGSNLLESIDNYGVLYQACANVVGNINDMSGQGSVTQGYQAPAVIYTYNAGGVNSQATALGTVNYLSEPLKQQIGGITITRNQLYTFQLPLMCLIGTLGDKYIPLHALAADLRVEITWNTGLASVVDTYDVATLITTTGSAANLNGATFSGYPSNLIGDTAGAFPLPFPNFSGTATQTSSSGTVGGAVSGIPVRTNGTVSVFTPTFQNVFLHATMVQISVSGRRIAIVKCLYYSLSANHPQPSTVSCRTTPRPRSMP